MKFGCLLRRTPVLSALVVAGTLCVLPVPSAHAKKYPEPSVYNLPGVWYLNFHHAVPKRIVVDVPGEKVPVAYWYMTYTVTNNSDKEVDFLPDFEMVTQDGKIHQADKNIPLPVFQAIKKAEGRTNDLLLSAAEIAGPLHRGEDQAKDGVAIWAEPMPRMGSFSIYAGGLNAEFLVMRTEDGKPMLDSAGHPITLRKTLEMNFTVWGDEVRPDIDEVHEKPERWIMR